MLDKSAIETNARVKNDIIAKLNNVDKKSRDYINDILILINKEIGVNKIVSIILFGSRFAKRVENSSVSDCDLLIIFKDRVSDRHLKEIKRYFISLEIKHNFKESYLNSPIMKQILVAIQQSTGMFMSFFLTKRKYWEESIFHKIFGVNKVICKLLAPKRIVIASVIDNSVLFYGQDLREIVKKKIVIPTFDMLKSITMNSILSIVTLLIIPFKSLNSINYQLEAVKWALRASNYYIFEDSMPLQKIVKRFTKFEKSNRSKRSDTDFFNRFLELRKNPRNDIGFMLKCPFRILKIHRKGLLLKKILRPKKK